MFYLNEESKIRKQMCCECNVSILTPLREINELYFIYTDNFKEIRIFNSYL